MTCSGPSITAGGKDSVQKYGHLLTKGDSALFILRTRYVEYKGTFAFASL